MLVKRFISFFAIIIFALIIVPVSANQNPFSNDFYSGKEEYTEIITEQGKTEKSQSVFYKDSYQGLDCYFFVTDLGDSKRTIILRKNFSPIKAYIEKEGNIFKEITYNEKEIIIKKDANIEKKIIYSNKNFYCQRESLEMILRGYNFLDGKIISITMISLDSEIYPMEIKLLGKEIVKTKLGEFECYKLVLSPGGLGKIFAAKYKNYFYFTVKPPHYFIKYYNDFIPTNLEVENNKSIK